MTDIKDLQDTIDYLEKNEFSDVCRKTKIFQEVSDISKYIFGDAEDFFGSASYAMFLGDMAQILPPDTLIKDINHESTEDLWVIEFKINNMKETINLADTDTDWLKVEFLEQFNDILLKHQSQVFARIVYTGSIEYADQTFDLCFINEEVYQKLKDTAPGYAR